VAAEDSTVAVASMVEAAVTVAVAVTDEAWVQ
jgi:hypothetical protein